MTAPELPSLQQEGKPMKQFFCIVTIVGGLIGALFLFLSFTATDSAPQQGALAAVAVGCAVVPYCITRAIQLMTDKREEILRSVVSEIRRGSFASQPDASVARTTRQEKAENNDVHGRTTSCPYCSETNIRGAWVCISCGKALPKNVKAEPAS